MAVIAGGKHHGIAPNANLFLAKTKAAYKGNDGNIRLAGVQPRALSWILDEIMAHITKIMERDSTAKSIINMSWGKSLKCVAFHLEDWH